MGRAADAGPSHGGGGDHGDKEMTCRLSVSTAALVRCVSPRNQGPAAWRDQTRPKRGHAGGQRQVDHLFGCVRRASRPAGQSPSESGGRTRAPGRAGWTGAFLLPSELVRVTSAVASLLCGRVRPEFEFPSLSSGGGYFAQEAGARAADPAGCRQPGWGGASRRRDSHSAATPSPFGRCSSVDREGVSAI